MKGTPQEITGMLRSLSGWTQQEIRETFGRYGERKKTVGADGPCTRTTQADERTPEMRRKLRGDGTWQITCGVGEAYHP